MRARLVSKQAQVSSHDCPRSGENLRDTVRVLAKRPRKTCPRRTSQSSVSSSCRCATYRWPWRPAVARSHCQRLHAPPSARQPRLAPMASAPVHNYTPRQPRHTSGLLPPMVSSHAKSYPCCLCHTVRTPGAGTGVELSQYAPACAAVHWWQRGQRAPRPARGWACRRAPVGHHHLTVANATAALPCTVYNKRPRLRERGGLPRASVARKLGLQGGDLPCACCGDASLASRSPLGPGLNLCPRAACGLQPPGSCRRDAV